MVAVRPRAPLGDGGCGGIGGVDRGGVGSDGCDDDVAMIMTVVVWGCRGVATEGGGGCGYGVVRVTMVRC
ncbi:hypothetical protein Tco_0902695 [Tanacetum coccineum]